MAGSLVPRPRGRLTCLLLLEVFIELKQRLQTPQAPAQPLSRPVVGSGDLAPESGRAFTFYRMDTRWQCNFVHLWDLALSTDVHLTVLIKYCLSPSPFLSQFQSLSLSPFLEAPDEEQAPDPRMPVHILRWRDCSQLRLGLGEDVASVVY